MESKPIHVVGAAIVAGGRCLVAQRGKGMSSAGLWEFPGGKIEPGEAPEQALAREILEELNLGIEVHEFVASGRVSSGDRQIQLDVYMASVVSGELELREHEAFRWVGPLELRKLDWAEADIPIVEHVCRRLNARAAPKQT